MNVKWLGKDLEVGDHGAFEDTLFEFPWDSVNIFNALILIDFSLAEMRTGYVWNASSEHYHYTKAFVSVVYWDMCSQIETYNTHKEVVSDVQNFSRKISTEETTWLT